MQRQLVRQDLAKLSSLGEYLAEVEMDAVSRLVELLSQKNPEIREEISRVLSKFLIDDFASKKSLHVFDVLVIFENIEQLAQIYSGKKVNTANATKWVTNNIILVN